MTKILIINFRFLEVCNTTFEVYMRWNSGKISSIPQDAEEEAYEVSFFGYCSNQTVHARADYFSPSAIN